MSRKRLTECAQNLVDTSDGPVCPDQLPSKIRKLRFIVEVKYRNKSNIKSQNSYPIRPCPIPQSQPCCTNLSRPAFPLPPTYNERISQFHHPIPIMSLPSLHNTAHLVCRKVKCPGRMFGFFLCCDFILFAPCRCYLRCWTKCQ
jgi:hypothetical protein